MAANWLHLMDDSGQTPLDRAFRSGHMNLAEIILQHEKDQQAGNLDGTPLLRAAALGLHRAVVSLLQCGADVQACNHLGETPLHAAVRAGNLQTVRALAPCSDVNAVCSRGLSPLHWACMAGRADMCEVLRAFGADPALRGTYVDGLSPLAIAQTMGYDTVVEVLGGEAFCGCAD